MFPTADLISLLFKLIPGFLAAAIFHSLTPYPKRDAIDRVITALIFTSFAQLLVSFVRPLLFLVGRCVSIGEWTSESELGWGLVFAALIALGFSFAVNNNYTHSWLFSLKITKKTSFPTQWYSAFHQHEQYMVLHLRGKRRIMGWAREWPDDPDAGHFRLQNFSWVDKDNQEHPGQAGSAILVSVKDVKWVEFLEHPENRSAEMADGHAPSPAPDTNVPTAMER